MFTMARLYAALTLVLCIALNAAASETYTFEDCSKPKNNVFTTYGANVRSQLSRHYNGDLQNCTFIFKAAEIDMTFLVMVLDIDIPTVDGTCKDGLTIRAYNQDLNNISLVLKNFCGSKVKEGIITDGHFLEVTWVGSSVTRGHVGFNMVVTAFKDPSIPCGTPRYARCNDDFCINSNLHCDGIYNCLNREDEVGCLTRSEQVGSRVVSTVRPLLTGIPVFDPSTTPSPVMTDSVYLWLPLMVVLVFTIVMVTLIMMGRRSNDNNNNRVTAQDIMDERIEFDQTTVGPPDMTDDDGDGMDSVTMLIIIGVMLLVLFLCFLVGCRKNEVSEQIQSTMSILRHRGDSTRVTRDPNYVEGEDRPATPPPSYSWIERQTSYASDISFTSSQLSFPPEYDEAIDLPGDTPLQQQPRRMRFLSRNSTSASRNGGPSRNSSSASRRNGRPRVPQRHGTFSPGDINARRGTHLQRSMSDGERGTMSERHQAPHRAVSSASPPHVPSRNASLRLAPNVPPPVPPLRFRIESNASSVFDEGGHSPPGSVISEEDPDAISNDTFEPIQHSNNNNINLEVTADLHTDGSDIALLGSQGSEQGSATSPTSSQSASLLR